MVRKENKDCKALSRASIAKLGQIASDQNVVFIDSLFGGKMVTTDLRLEVNFGSGVRFRKEVDRTTGAPWGFTTQRMTFANLPGPKTNSLRLYRFGEDEEE